MVSEIERKGMEKVDLKSFSAGLPNRKCDRNRGLRAPPSLLRSAVTIEP
jgi:hypothetical protein